MNDYTQISFLISSLQNKDLDSYTYLYDQYATALYGISYRIVHNVQDASDILHEVFIDVYNRIHLFNSYNGITLFTWMSQITYTKAYACYQKKQN